jgi:hypothetical protein
MITPEILANKFPSSISSFGRLQTYLFCIS